MDKTNQDKEKVITLTPIGVVRNKSRQPSWGEAMGRHTWQERAARMDAQRQSVSEIIVNKEYADALDGIEEFSHLTVIFWAHLVPPERRDATRRVHPMGNEDFPLVGVFATHSPVRPNPILITVARLLERNGNILRVSGLDALDGSPVLDIKPYAPYRLEREEVRTADWMRRINREFDGDEAAEQS